MFKHYLMIGFGIFLIGIVLAAQAQDDEQITQPTIDAAVATLIAQTQQPQITQTIQAALEQALTATVAAQPIEAGDLSLGSTIDLDLMAGPGFSSAYLAPDGETLAHLNIDGLCFYEGDQQQTCVDLSPLESVDTESIRWSPDSRYVVLHEDFMRTLDDPDVWLIDTADGTLSNLTDDGIANIRGSEGQDIHVDIQPDWTDDGQILFLRYKRDGSDTLPPEIHQMAIDGSGDTLLGVISTDSSFAVSTLDVWQDKLVYAYRGRGDFSLNGVWISDLNGENAKQLIRVTREAPASAVQMSPDGRYVLYRVETDRLNADYSPESSWARVVEVETGREIFLDSEQFVAGAGWSPQGSALIYLTYEPAAESGGVYLTAVPGEAGKLLLTGQFNGPTSRLQQFLRWGVNNTVLISRSPVRGVVLMQLAR